MQQNEGTKMSTEVFISQAQGGGIVRVKGKEGARIFVSQLVTYLEEVIEFGNGTSARL